MKPRKPPIVAPLACSPLCHISMKFPVRYLKKKKAGVNFTEPKSTCGQTAHLARAETGGEAHCEKSTLRRRVGGREMMCYTKVFHNKHTLTVIRPFAAGLFGLLYNVQVPGRGKRRRAER